MKKKFKKTWRHQVNIEAETAEEAKSIFENINLGQLDREVADGEILSHQFMYEISLEDEDYNNV